LNQKPTLTNNHLKSQNNHLRNQNNNLNHLKSLNNPHKSLSNSQSQNKFLLKNNLLLNNHLKNKKLNLKIKIRSQLTKKLQFQRLKKKEFSISSVIFSQAMMM
jgi:hypothetical protein